MKERSYTVAILGATGAVGSRLIEQLAQSSIPVASLKLLASARSAGQTREFRGETITIEEAQPESFEGRLGIGISWWFRISSSVARSGKARGGCRRQYLILAHERQCTVGRA